MAHAVQTSISRSSHRARPTTFAGRALAYFALAKQRRDLASLDQHMLNDIGITRAQAEKEAEKSAWDVPQHWQI